MPSRFTQLLIALVFSLVGERELSAAPSLLLLPGAPENSETRAGKVFEIEGSDSLEIFRMRKSGKTASLPFFLMPMQLSSGCSEATPTIQSSLDTAYEALDFLDLPEAATSLGEIKQALKCASVLPTADDLARLYFAMGVFEVYDGRQGTRYFADAISLNTNLPRVADYPDSVVAAFEEGQASLKTRGRHQVNIKKSEISGAQIYVDGRPVEGSSLYLPLGAHVIGWGLESGRHMGSQMIAVLASDPEPLMWPPEELEPLELSGVSEALITAVSQGQLLPAWEGALRRWLSYEGVDEVLLVGPEGSALLLSQNEAPKSIYLPEEKSRPKLGKTGMAIGAGTLALGCGGYYTYAYRRLSTEVFSTEDELTKFHRKGQAAGILAVGFSLTSATFIGLSVMDGREDDPYADSGGAILPMMAQLGGTW